MAIVMLLSIAPFGGMQAKAASWSSDYRNWSQAASDIAGMRSYGCWVVAQAKMIYEANINRESSFNPDTYYWWQKNNGYINDGFYQTNGGYAPVAYAKQRGKDLEYLGYWDASDNQLWFNINAGYYTIVHVENHYVLIANALSKQYGQIYCYDSWTDYTPSRPQPLTRYSYHYGGYVYKCNTALPTVSGSWEGPSVGNITETNAIASAKINFNQKVNTTAAGLRIYDNNNNLVASSKGDNVNYNSTYVSFTYNINSELGYVLTSGKTYKVRFYTVSNGKEYWSPIASFTTPHTHKYTSKITTAATCTADGVKTFTCSCGNKYTETIPALGHTDANMDGKCDRCGYESTNPDTPNTPDTPDTPSSSCSHICHKGGISKVFYKIARFFWKLFKINKYCSCGAAHY